MKRKHRMDLTDGSVLKKLILFSFPIILTNLLQQLYHAADMVVVGNFATDPTTALAAVGSTASITSLCLNLFIGLSVGVNVLCANLYGAREEEKLRRAMHTSVLLAFLCGVFIGALGFVFTRPLLDWMGSPESVIDQATIYMKIIFLGQPGSLVFNFGAGILRSHGDTRRPMFILSAAGIFNFLLNLVFVVFFHLDAAGVALATILSNYASAAIVLYLLFAPRGGFGLKGKELKLHAPELKKIVSVGLPCGLNGMVFSFSNVIIVSALNSLGETVLAANSAAHNIDALYNQVLTAFSSACVSFAGQNFGAKKYGRIDRCLGGSVFLCGVLMLCANLILFLLPETAMGLFTKDPAVVSFGVSRLFILCGCYPIYILPEMCLGCIRGMGKSALSSSLNMFFICIPRMIWVWLAFPLRPTFAFLLWCYPISWGCSALAQFACYLYYRIRLKKGVSFA